MYWLVSIVCNLWLHQLFWSDKADHSYGRQHSTFFSIDFHSQFCFTLIFFLCKTCTQCFSFFPFLTNLFILSFSFIRTEHDSNPLDRIHKHTHTHTHLTLPVAYISNIYTHIYIVSPIDWTRKFSLESKVVRECDCLLACLPL